MSEKRNHILYGGAIGLLGASLYFVGTNLWDRSSLGKEKKSAEQIIADDPAFREEEIAKVAKLREFVEPCFDSAYDLRNLAQRSEIKVSDLSEQSTATKEICDEQVGAMEGAQLDLDEQQQDVFGKCKAALSLQSRLADEFLKITASPNEIGEQDEEDRLVALAGQVNSQLSECDSKLMTLEVPGELLEAFSREKD